jgi:hypothetical protein
MSLPGAWRQVLNFFGTPLVIEPSPDIGELARFITVGDDHLADETGRVSATRTLRALVSMKEWPRREEAVLLSGW